MSLEQLISDYGYWAIAIGTFIEGETILVLGGFAAHRGYLELPWVIFYAFLGTMFGDQVYYYLGRFKGVTFLQRRPHWQAKSQYVFNLLEKHQILLILGFRFLYGLRTITPFLIGTSRISPVRFLVLNVAGAAIWAVVIGTGGYVLGQSLEIIITDIKHYEVWVFFGVGLVGIVFWLLRSRRFR